MISIRRQLTRNLLGTSLLLFGAGLIAMYVAAHITLLRQFDAALRTKAQAISTLTVDAGTEVRLEFTDEFLRGFDDDSPRDFFTLWRVDGGQIARSESLRRRELPRPKATWKGTRYWNLTLPNGRPGRAVGYVFKPEKRGPPGNRGEEVDVLLVVASDRRALNATLYQLIGVAGGAGLLLLGATLVAIPLALRRGLQPLKRLGDQAAQIDAQSLSARFPASDLPAELQPIAGRLNELLQRIEASFARERRFSADLAHELRTPLAELRTITETALKWPEARDPAVDRDTLAIALQMEALVTSMLMLARGETGQLNARREKLELAPLVEEVWRTYSARASARELKVGLDLAAGSVLTDPALLRTILANLFDNAVEYTPAGGEVSINLRTAGEQATLQVANTTDNLTPADSGRLFERFWRKDAARSGGRHFGLGLSLASACAGAMGWALTGNVDANGTVRFMLSSPKSPGRVSAPAVTGG